MCRSKFCDKSLVQISMHSLKTSGAESCFFGYFRVGDNPTRTRKNSILHVQWALSPVAWPRGLIQLNQDCR